MAEVDTTMLSQDHAHIRREGAEHASEIRYDVATRAGDIRQEVAGAACELSKQVGAGFADTRYNIAERAGDIRREQQAGFGQTRVDLADVKDVLNDSVRVEGGQTRTQVAHETNEIVKEGLKGDFNTVNAVKDSRFEVITRMGEAAAQITKTITDSSGDVADRVERNADRSEAHLSRVDNSINDRFFTVGRDLADLRMGQVGIGKDIELNALKTQLDARTNTQYLTDKIVTEGEKTRALMNDMKYHDLNRALVERQTSLVNCEQDNRTWGHRYDDARWGQFQSQWGTQFAAMQSQLQSMNQNFNSQLAETRQGMVNFGTMAGVGQSSTNNNVR
jgi:gas vesicle protein